MPLVCDRLHRPIPVSSLAEEAMMTACPMCATWQVAFCCLQLWLTRRWGSGGTQAAPRKLQSGTPDEEDAWENVRGQRVAAALSGVITQPLLARGLAGMDFALAPSVWDACETLAQGQR